MILEAFVNICLQASQEENVFFPLGFPYRVLFFLDPRSVKKRGENKETSGLGRLPCFQEEIGSISWRKTMYLFQAENKIENSHAMQ